MLESRRMLYVLGILVLLGLIVAVFVLTASPAPVETPTPTPTLGPSPSPTPSPTSTPSPTPTPPPGEVLEGRYLREVTLENAPEAQNYQLGTWGLELKAGTFTIAHGSFITSGSYTASEEEIVFTNDRGCPEAAGTYQWTLVGNRLTLVVVSDPCAGGTRADDLTLLPWTKLD